MTNVYPVAAEAAARIAERFVEDAAATDDPKLQGLLPGLGSIETMINAAFWASLRREEGKIPTISLAYMPPDLSRQPIRFARPLSLDPAQLARLSPAVERPGIHLGVWPDSGSENGSDPLRVWGTTRNVPRVAFVLEVVAPGLLVIKHRRLDGPGKFVNVAVLEGDRLRLLDHHSPRLAHCPVLVSTLLGFESPSAWVESANVLVQLAVSMRNHRRGGTLLVVPSGNEAWRNSIIHPITYAVAPGSGEPVRPAPADPARSEFEINHEIEALAGLTAVDGATIISDRYALLAFGAKIRRREGSAPVDKVVLLEPVVGGASSILSPNQLGGTRHLSAAQFVHDQRDAVGLVASQDGEFTIFLWSPEDELVHAHRITVFLL